MVRSEVNTQAVPVSVILPCFRCSETIGRAIGSVIAQRVRPSEVILVDDGSNDDTLAKLYGFQAQYGSDWIEVVSLNENKGPSIARNTGWELANEQYIAFLDADDAWHPEKLKMQYNWMANHPEVALSGHRCLWIKDMRHNLSVPTTCRARQIRKWNLLLSNSFLTSTVMLKRTLRFRFDASRQCSEDFLLWNQIVLSGFKASYLEVSLAYMYKAPYGARGISEDLWKMEMGELRTYNRLRSERLLSWPTFAGLSAFSITKYIRRLVISQLRSPENGERRV